MSETTLLTTMETLEQRLKNELSTNGMSYRYQLILFDLSAIYMRISTTYKQRVKRVDNHPEFEPLCLSGPPSCPGVYGVFEYINREEHILYIGSSKDIGKRVMAPTHWYRTLYSEGRSICTRSIRCDNYEEVEKEMIRKYQPPLNKQMYG